MKLEEKKRLDTVEEWRKQVELLKQTLDEHQMITQKMRAEHEEDKIEWNKQHQEHLLSVEVGFYFGINFIIIIETLLNTSESIRR